MVNRNRNCTLSLRLTAREKDLLREKAAQSSLTVTEYIVSSLLDGKEAELECLRGILKLMRNMSQTLDMMTGRFSDDVVQKQELQEVKDLQNNIVFSQLIKLSASERR